jgi:hypothetical protein
MCNSQDLTLRTRADRRRSWLSAAAEASARSLSQVTPLRTPIVAVLTMDRVELLQPRLVTLH